MDLDFSKIWLAGAGSLVGAIAGAAVWAQRAAGLASRAAEKAGEDALIHAASNTGAQVLGAAIQGALVGGVLGAIAVFVYLYFSDPDREMPVQEVRRDPEEEDAESGMRVWKSELDSNR